MKTTMLTLIIALMLVVSTSFAQDFYFFGKYDLEYYTSIENASFEHPISWRTERGWKDEGFTKETPPTQHISFDNQWKVNRPAYDGNKFLSMVVRANNTWERISTGLDDPLYAGHEYIFAFYASAAETLVSGGHTEITSGNKVDHDSPVVIRVWGSDEGYGVNTQLLYTSDPIYYGSEWNEYEVLFTPENDIRYLTIEVFYITPVAFPYNGHILLDNISDIYELKNSTTHLIPNKSFEKKIDWTGDSGWLNSEMWPKETPPTQHTSRDLQYLVDEKAKRGKHYLSMVARKNKTWEAIYTKLENPLQPFNEYKWTFNARMANDYWGPPNDSTFTTRVVAYDQPLVIRIWSISEEGKWQEMLFESLEVNHKNWEKYEAWFMPTKEVYYVLVEAFWAREGGQIKTAYNGHVLLDDFSDILQIEE